MSVDYLAGTSSRENLVRSTLTGVRRALDECSGDILVFLPGAAEIRRAAERLQVTAQKEGVRLCPLYGNLGVEPHPDWVANPACHWTAENSSWFRTYAAAATNPVDALRVE